jgi:hypothetical protein
MARLAWIASELGSATGFPKRNIIPQKPQPDAGPEFAGRCLPYPPHSTPLLLPDGMPKRLTPVLLAIRNLPDPSRVPHSCESIKPMPARDAAALSPRQLPKRSQMRRLRVWALIDQKLRGHAAVLRAHRVVRVGFRFAQGRKAGRPRRGKAWT